MNPELVLLSARIAGLVLLASVLAFGLAWWWQSLRLRTAVQHSEQDENRRVQVEHQAEEFKQQLAATEQQCVAALEQRDEAEREAVARRNESVRLSDQMARLHETTVPREELERLKEKLAERDQDLWQPRQPAVDAASPLQAEVESLRSERDALAGKVAEGSAVIERLEEEKLAAETAVQERDAARTELELAKGAAESLRAERDTLQLKTENLSAAIERMGEEGRAAEAALQARIDELSQPAVAPRTFTLTSPRLTAQPFLPPAAAEAPTADAAPGEGPMEFPPAPAREDMRDGLFRDAEIASLPPDQPSLEDVNEVVTRMALELDEKEQVLSAVTQELKQREDSLADLRGEEPDGSDKVKAAEKRLTEAQKRSDDAALECQRARRHLNAVRRSIEVLESHPLRADNLTLIKGVKTVINSQLHAYGIFTYRQIVQWNEEDLQAFSELLSFKQRIWRDKWQEQARQLHESRYGEKLPV